MINDNFISVTLSDFSRTIKLLYVETKSNPGCSATSVEMNGRTVDVDEINDYEPVQCALSCKLYFKRPQS